MILVDSCVWIDHLAGRENPAVSFFKRITEEANGEICISGLIYLEVLRGIERPSDRHRVASIFEKLICLDFSHGSYKKILGHDQECRKHGLNLPKLGDWLIIQTALDHDLEILTSDKDFLKINRYIPFKLVHLV